MLLGLSIENGDPGVTCTDGFDVQSQSSTFDTALVDGIFFIIKLKYKSKFNFDRVLKRVWKLWCSCGVLSYICHIYKNNFAKFIFGCFA